MSDKIAEQLDRDTDFERLRGDVFEKQLNTARAENVNLSAALKTALANEIRLIDERGVARAEVEREKEAHASTIQAREEDRQRLRAEVEALTKAIRQLRADAAKRDASLASLREAARAWVVSDGNAVDAFERVEELLSGAEAQPSPLAAENAVLRKLLVEARSTIKALYDAEASRAVKLDIAVLLTPAILVARIDRVLSKGGEE